MSHRSLSLALLPSVACSTIACSTVACSTQGQRPDPPVDCLAVAEEYETSTLQDFEMEDVQWYGVDDLTPGAEVGDDVNKNPASEAVPDVREAGAQEPGRCGSTRAIVFRARGFTTWGAFFADWTTVMANVTTLHEWEGFSFWARTAPGSDRSFFLEVDNAHTALVNEDQPDAAVNLCVAEIEENGDDTGRYPEGTDPAETCENSYRAIVTTGEDWRFFAIPFEDLIQDRDQPNVRESGFDPTVQLVRFRVKFPVETDIELWLDDLGTYRSW